MTALQMSPVSAAKNSGKDTTKAAKGAAGHAFALVLIKDAEARAEAEAKKQESLKSRLEKLMPMSREDHLEFRKVLTAKREEITAAATALNMSQAKYMEGDTRASVVNVTVSLWLKLSNAVEKGYKPDFDAPWAAISAGATDHIAAAANTTTGTGARNQGPTARKGRIGKSAVVKLADFVKQNDLSKAIAKDAPKPTDTVKVRVELVGAIEAMFKGMTFAELEHVQVRLAKAMDEAKTREAKPKATRQRAATESRQMAAAA
jgi:hypothetical protein